MPFGIPNFAIWFWDNVKALDCAQKCEGTIVRPAEQVFVHFTSSYTSLCTCLQRTVELAITCSICTLPLPFIKRPFNLRESLRTTRFQVATFNRPGCIRLGFKRPGYNRLQSQFCPVVYPLKRSFNLENFQWKIFKFPKSSPSRTMQVRWSYLLSLPLGQKFWYLYASLYIQEFFRQKSSTHR